MTLTYLVFLRLQRVRLRLITLINQRGRKPVADCPSFWSTSLHSDYILVQARVCLLLVCGHFNRETTSPAQLLLDIIRRIEFGSDISAQLSSQRHAHESRKHWEQIEIAMHSVRTVTENSWSCEHEKWQVALTSFVLFRISR